MSHFIDKARPDLKDKSILVTGGTGSLGGQLTRTLLRHYQPRRVAVYARDEFDHFEFQNSLATKDLPRFRSFIGDVRDVDRLFMACQGVDVIVHAAALKQIPMAEYNPFECIRTNVIGAQNVVQAAIRCKVPKVIALSTDKAVNPINLYGASKLAADKIFVAANSLGSGSGTRFSVVRYGNVLGSKGSIVPFFLKLMREGATSLPITDDRMTRFWITLPQAVDFVLSSLVLMRGGEIFVPKIPSMKITDLAMAIAPHLPQDIIGIRPGEKLHELMIDSHSARTTVDMGDRFVIEPEWRFWPYRSFTEDGYSLVPDDFEYSSDLNDSWMEENELVSAIPVNERAA